MRKQETTNSFQDGLIMDLNPLVTPNNVVTNCLNGTLVTFNGNENVLQNDMGNGRVETAFLPEGYVPLGTTELGGIIYIVSYNPFTKKCQIGSFPSPERNITSDEVSGLGDVQFSQSEFKTGDHIITSPIIKKKLTDIILHPGDKFLVCGNSLTSNIDTISQYNNDSEFINKYIDFRIATVDENGRFIYLTDLRKYKIGDGFLNIQDGEIKSNPDVDLDNYRELVGTNYSIFTSRVAGELYIVGQLEVIDYIESINWNLVDVSVDPFDDVNDVIKVSETSNVSKVKQQYYKIHFDVTMFSERQNITSGLLLTGKESDKIEIDNTTKDRQYRHTISFDIAFQASQNDSYDLTITPCMKFGILEYLKETIHFDFSLLGSNQVINNIWKYWRDENSMQLRFDLNNYHVNQNIRQIQLRFQNLEEGKRPDFPNDEKSWVTVDLPIKESYAGINTVSMLFTPDFIADSIYIVQVWYKLHSDQKEGEETKEEKWQYVENSSHILYTNGVYNELYIRSDIPNFDLEYLPLKPTMELSHIPDIITFETENKLVNKDNKFVSKDNPGANAKIQGETIYTSKGQSTVTVSTSFKNTFNKTFSLDKSAVSAEFVNEQQVVINQDSISIDLDSEYFNPYKDLKLLNSEKINITLEDSGKDGERLLNYDILLKSPISATYGTRSVGVDNYYASILHTEDDFYKLGMIYGNITAEAGQKVVIPDITLDLSGPGLGITAGGKDNNGGGGIRYVYGHATVINENGSLSLYGEAPEEFETSGKPGIKRFPNNDVSAIINEARPDCGIVPVFLVNIGTSWFKYNNGVERRFNGTNNRGGADSRQTEWFNTETPCDFASVLLFGRAKESENFVPLDYSIIIKGDINEQKTYLKRYCALLSQLFSKRKFEGLISIYTVGSIGYINRKFTVTKQVKAKSPYEDSKLLFNDKPLSEIKNNVPREKSRFDEEAYWNNEVKCFSVDPTQKDIEMIQDLEFNFNIVNKYLDTYEQYQSSATIPAYVAANRPLEPPSIINSKNIYVVSDGKLITQDIYPPIYEITDLTITDGEINPELTTNRLSEIQDISMFSYDDRNETLGLVSQGSIRQGTFIAFGSGTNTKYTDNTYLVSAKIDTKQTLNNLPS